MKILILKGSPHKSGSTHLLIEQFAAGAAETGHQVTIYDAAHMDIHPCQGCGSCEMYKGCVQKDEMGQLEDAILDADMLVFATPVYYFGISAQLKMVIDRFYGINKKLREKKTKAMLIAVSAEDDEDAMIYLQNHYLKICRYMHFENKGMILGLGCGTPEKTKNTHFMKEAYLLGKAQN